MGVDVFNARRAFCGQILKHVDWVKVGVIAGIVVAHCALAPLIPEEAAVAVMVGGAAVGGGLAVYDEIYLKLKTGQKICWPQALIRILGGGIKGALCSSKLGTFATGGSVGATATLEELLCQASAGNLSPEACKQGFANGAVEGLTAGSLQWLCGKMLPRVGSRMNGKSVGQTSPKIASRTNPSSAKPNIPVGKTRVGRWMCEEEYRKMLETGKVQLEPDTNLSFVSSPPSETSFLGAKKGSVYVEFDVDTVCLRQGGKEDWRQIAGPGSRWEKLDKLRGFSPVTDIPSAMNIKLVRKK